MEYLLRPAKRLVGTVGVPADKSVAHRAALFAAIAEGTSRIQGYPRGADTLTTLSCLERLGVTIGWENGSVVVEGRGRHGLRAPDEPLDCGNSGTTMRLLAGLLAGQPFESVLTGDESLSRRPMDRIAQPLREMGARIELNDGRAPIHIKGGSRLHGIEYVLPVASAQVKSAVLLAGLYAEGSTVVVETTPSRDHTERMLALPIEKSETQSLIRSDATVPVEAVDITLPGDISSAAFFMVGALIVEDSSIRLTQVGINPSRTGIIDVLERAGAVFEATGHRMLGKEPVCDLTVSQTSLDAISVTPALAPRLIDEIPILAVAAARAGGISSFEGIGELRAKESDRIDSTSSLLRKMGASVSNDETSLQVAGGATLTGANIDGCGDHRIVMAAAIAGLAATGETRIAGAEAANVSYPGFWDDVERLAVR